jgi:hypothetical protein
VLLYRRLTAWDRVIAVTPRCIRSSTTSLRVAFRGTTVHSWRLSIDFRTSSSLPTQSPACDSISVTLCWFILQDRPGDFSHFSLSHTHTHSWFPNSPYYSGEILLYWLGDYHPYLIYVRDIYRSNRVTLTTPISGYDHRLLFWSFSGFVRTQLAFACNGPTSHHGHGTHVHTGELLWRPARTGVARSHNRMVARA